MTKQDNPDNTLAKLQFYGYNGEGTTPFDDSDFIGSSNIKIKSIDVRCGEIIDSISVCYTNGAVTPTHGGEEGNLEKLIFDADEYLVEINGFYGMWWNITVIKQITFVTTKKSVTFGTNIYPTCSTPFSIKSSLEYPIEGFYGASITSEHGTFLSGIGAIVFTSDLPSFYRVARNSIVSSLYDPVFSIIENEIGWTDYDEKANIIFKQLKTKVTSQSGYFDNPYEAQYFNAIKDKIQATDLYLFLKGLPKGAILHLHPSSMGDYTNLLNLAAQYKGDVCQVRFNYTDDSKTIIDPVNIDPNSFQWLSNPNTTPPIIKYPGQYMNLSDVLKDPVLRQAAIDLMVLSPNVMDYQGDMWDLFEPIFSRAGTILGKTDLKTTFYNDAFGYLVREDNLTHVEIRSNWNAANENIAGTTENIIINAANAAGITLKVINFNSRHIDESTPICPSVCQNVVNTGNQLLDKNNKYLCGYDLVGEEDTGATTQFLTDDFYTAFCQLNNYLPPFFFHDGESDLAPDYDPSDAGDMGDPQTTYFNNNLVDAYLLNTMNFDGFQMTTNRVGHGLELFKSPKLLEDYKTANLAVELCPISNQLLRYIKDLREHPGQSYLACGLLVSLNPDDPAIYGYQGVSFDFWESSVAWGLDLKMVKVLCYYSLKSSTLTESEKGDAIADWKEKWDQYIQNFITTT
ncbi:MAG TPA: hypothetical protein VHT34_01480 [Clostridia bacterium]|nr:hypothetical protein [Clostridia bacterium]